MKIFTIILCIVIAFVIISGSVVGGTIWWYLQPVSTQAQEEDFVIAKGDTFTGVAKKLEEQGYIKSALALRVLVRLSGQEAIIHPGSIKISKSMTPQAILMTLFSEPDDVWVTLLEGWRLEEIAHELDTKLSDSFDEDEFITLAKEEEGRLFPDTYLFPKEASASFVLSTLENTFEKRLKAAKAEAGQSEFLDDEVVIIASLLEREAREPQDMKVVAGILQNRLKIGMPLQVDATLQYVKGFDSALGTWWPEPKAADKDLESPFNTYKNRGLPPSPISNPGYNALVAAIHPDSTDYLFYISDRQGTMHYAKTLDEHNANVNKYLR